MIIASRSGQPHIRFVGKAYRLDILMYGMSTTLSSNANVLNSIL